MSLDNFYNAAQIPVKYTHLYRAWMDRATFGDWYNDIFIPAVEDYQRRSGTSGNVLLLLDNAPGHSSPEVLDRGRFMVMYLPAN